MLMGVANCVTRPPFINSCMDQTGDPMIALGDRSVYGRERERSE